MSETPKRKNPRPVRFSDEEDAAIAKAAAKANLTEHGWIISAVREKLGLDKPKTVKNPRSGVSTVMPRFKTGKRPK